MVRQLIFALVLTLIIVETSFTQTPPPHSPIGRPRPSRKVGKALITYYSEADISQSSILFDLSGKFENLQTEDNLKMALIFESKGKMVSKPESISLAIYHFSMGENTVFKSNHNLSIIIKGTQLLSNDLLLSASRQLDPAGRYEEDYRKSIPYQILKKMAESKQVKIKFGNKEIDLDTSQLEAISDLYKTIEQ